MPHNDVVYKLRESMLTASDGENSPALETVILEEIKARPEDVKLRVCQSLKCSASHKSCYADPSGDPLSEDGAHPRRLQPLLRAGGQTPVAQLPRMVFLSCRDGRKLSGGIIPLF